MHEVVGGLDEQNTFDSKPLLITIFLQQSKLHVIHKECTGVLLWPQ